MPNYWSIVAQTAKAVNKAISIAIDDVVVNMDENV